MLLKGVIAAGGKVLEGGLDYSSAMVLYLRGKDSNVVYNNLKSFKDYSSNNFSITANSDARISTVIKRSRNSSMYFNGQTSSLSLTNNDAFNLSDTDWTIEAWIYPLGNYGTFNTIIAKRNSTSTGTSNVDWQLYLDSSTGGISFYNGSTSAESNAVPISFQWNHVAAVRNGSDIKLFLNGNEVYSFVGGANSGSWNVSVGSLSNGTSEKFYGYIESIRVTKGEARYTSTFTPPEEAFVDSDPDVSLLLHADGTNGSTSFVDSSVSSVTLTSVGGAQISTSQKKFGTGSALFNGPTAYIETPENSEHAAFYNDDFTIEWWEYVNGWSGGYFPIFHFGSMGDATNFSSQIGIRYESSGAILRVGMTATNYDFTSLSTPLNVWRHCALVRKNGILNLYRDGVKHPTSHLADKPIRPRNSKGIIGGAFFGSSNGTLYSANGYIDELRITKNKALYTSFNSLNIDLLNDSSNVSLLISTQTPTANTSWIDSSLFLQEMDPATDGTGHVVSSSSITKFGSNSLFFSENGFLRSYSNSLIFADDNFVLEAWIYPTTNTIGCIMNQGDSDNSTSFCFYRDANSKLGFYSAGNIIATSTGVNVPINEWTHVALVRSGDMYSIYVNGILDKQSNSSSVRSFSSTPFKIGDGYGGIIRFNGYMDDIKVTRGFNKYKTILGTFVSPSKQLNQKYPAIPNSITKSGLILYLGPESFKNYPVLDSGGYRGMWEDLSQNKYHHRLTSTEYKTSSLVPSVFMSANGDRLRAESQNTFTYGPNHTVIIWAKMISDAKTSTYRTLLRASPNDHPILVQNNSNIIGYYDSDTNAFYSYGLNLGDYGLESNWAMYTLVGQNGTSSKVYINGTLIQSNSINFNTIGNKHIEVGDHAGSQPFGDIGHVIAYDRVLTESEIQKIFNVSRKRYGVPSSNDNLVLHLDASNPKSYSKGFVWKDLSNVIGNINVQSRSTDWSFQTDPQTGLTCLYNETDRSSPNFPGIDVPLKGFNKYQGALELWIKPTSFDNGGVHGWFSNTDGNANFTNSSDWFWIGTWENSSLLYFRLGNPNNSITELTISNFQTNHYQLNTWVHFCMTWHIPNRVLRVYKNGSQIASSVNSISTAIRDRYPTEFGSLFLGHSRTSDNAQFKGYCNIYKIYNKELSAAQVLSNYNSTKSRFGL